MAARQRDLIARRVGAARRSAATSRPFEGSGFVGIDVATDLDDAALRAAACSNSIDENLLRLGAATRTCGRRCSSATRRTPRRGCGAVAGDKYSYRELDDFTDLIKRTLQTVPQVSKITRAGLLAGADLPRVLAGAPRARTACSCRSSPTSCGARNITLPGGLHRRPAASTWPIDPSGEFTTEHGDRRRHRRHLGRRAGRSTCATSSTSSAATRARRAT